MHGLRVLVLVLLAFPAWAEGLPTPVVFCSAPTEGPQPELERALAAVHLSLLPGGALRHAGQTVVAARRAVAELRCSEARPALEQAEERLLAETAVADARGTLGQIEALLLICADRLGDETRAGRAADRLLMAGMPVPPDAQLVLRRYRPGPLFGPAPPPSYVETEPKGAQLIRDLLKVGTAPGAVPGGDPEADLLDVELPGWRKVHRPLGSGEKLFFGLQAEDRLAVLSDAISAREIGSAEQTAALGQLAGLKDLRRPFGARLLVVGPAQRGGQAVAGERLKARVYDLDQRRWLGPAADVPAGAASEQAQRLVALVQGKAPPAASGASVAKATPAKKAESTSSGGFLGLRFTKAKWYSWVVAGGVAAVIVGLLVADHFSTDSVTVHAAH